MPSHSVPIPWCACAGTHGVHGLRGLSIASPGVGWATRRPGDPVQTTIPRWSPPFTIVAPPRWPVGDEARDLTTHPPRLWLAP